MAKPLKIRFKVAGELKVPRSCQNGHAVNRGYTVQQGAGAVNRVSLQATARIGVSGGPVAPSCEGRVHLASPGFDL